MRILLFIGVFITCTFLASCTLVRSNVTSFHDLSTPPELTKYAFFLLEGQDTLEHRSYLNLVSNELARYGYEEVSIEYSEIIVVLAYGIDDGKTVSRNIPIWGQTGVQSSTTTGQINTYGNYGTFSGTTTYTPTYGVTGYTTAQSTKYKREVYVNFYDTSSVLEGNPTSILETRAISEGSSNEISAVMPSIIKAIFKDFPGESGKTRRVDIQTNQ